MSDGEVRYCTECGGSSLSYRVGSSLHDSRDDDGLHKTPTNAVALAPGRTPEQARALKEIVENE